MSVATTARNTALDRASDAAVPTKELASELFAVVALLETQPGMRNALTDPTVSPQVRAQLATSLLVHKISDAALQIVCEMSQLRWTDGDEAVRVLDRQGVRVLLAQAHAAGHLDQLETELFSFERVVAANKELRDALEAKEVPLALREQLVCALLQGKVLESALELAKHAVAARSRNFKLTMDEILQLAAAARERVVAKVKVAQALTDSQMARLRTALASQIGHAVSLQVAIDPAILGGVFVQVGDEIIDGTVVGRLTAAEKQLNIPT